MPYADPKLKTLARSASHWKKLYEALKVELEVSQAQRIALAAWVRIHQPEMFHQMVKEGVL